MAMLDALLCRWFLSVGQLGVSLGEPSLLFFPRDARRSLKRKEADMFHLERWLRPADGPQSLERVCCERAQVDEFDWEEERGLGCCIMLE